MIYHWVFIGKNVRVEERVAGPGVRCSCRAGHVGQREGVVPGEEVTGREKEGGMEERDREERKEEGVKRERKRK